MNVHVRFQICSQRLFNASLARDVALTKGFTKRLQMITAWKSLLLKENEDVGCSFGQNSRPLSFCLECSL